MKTCEKCGEEISTWNYSYEGICEKCWRKALKDNSNDQENKESNLKKETERVSATNDNMVAVSIKAIAIIEAIIGICCGLSMEVEELRATIVIASVISAVFMYGFGEIIQKLENIEKNTKR